MVCSFTMALKGVVFGLALCASTRAWANTWSDGAWSESVAANQDLVINITDDTELSISDSAITVNSIVVNGTGKLTITGSRVTLTTQLTANTDVETSTDSLWFGPKGQAGLSVAENKTFTFTVKQGGDVSGIIGPGKVVKKGSSDWWIANGNGNSVAITDGAEIDIQAGTVYLNGATVETAKIKIGSNVWFGNYGDATISAGHTLTLEIASGVTRDDANVYNGNYVGGGNLVLCGGGRFNLKKPACNITGSITVNDGSTLGLKQGGSGSPSSVGGNGYIALDDGTVYPAAYGALIHALSFNGNETDYGLNALSGAGYSSTDSSRYEQTDLGKACLLSSSVPATAMYGGNAKVSGTSGDFTMSARAKTQAANKTILVSFGNNAKGMGFRTDNAGQVQFVSWVNGSDIHYTEFSSVATPTTRYHVYSIVYNATDRKVVFYADGSQVGDAIDYTLDITDGKFQFGSIHGNSNAGNASTAIYMDDFRFYRKALSQEQLSAQYAHDVWPATCYSATVSTDTNWNDIVWNEGLLKVLTDTTYSVDVAEGATLTKNTVSDLDNISGTTRVYGTVNIDGVGLKGVILVDNGGVVNTEGNIALSGKNRVLAGGVLNVNSGNLTLTSSQRYSDGVGSAGTFNIAVGATLTANSSDTLDYAAGGTVNVYGTLDLANKNWTLGPGCVIRVFSGGIVNGSNSNALHLNSGSGSIIRASKVADELSGTATINCPIILGAGTGGEIRTDEGMTLVITANALGGDAAKRVSKTGPGCLKFQRESSGTTYLSAEAGSVEVADNWTYDLGALRDFSNIYVADGNEPTIKVRQTDLEYWKGGMVISNIDSSISAIAIVKHDATEHSVSVSDGSIIVRETPVVSTAACWHDYEFEGTVNDGVSSGTVNLATNWGDSSDIYSYENGESGNQVMKLSQRGGNTSVVYPEEWSAALRCMVPSNNKGWIIAFGSQGGGAIGLAAGETTGKVMLVHSESSSKYTKLADMLIGAPTTAYHVYAVVKTASEINIYCDGELACRQPFTGAIANGFQIGTMLHGAAPLAQASDGKIDYLRLYNYALSADQIEKLHVDNEYVSPTPLYTRSISGDGVWWYTGADTWTKTDDSSTSGKPDEVGRVEVTAIADATVTMNLPSDTLFEKLTFQGEGAVTLVKNGTHKLGAIELEVKTDITVPYNMIEGFTKMRIKVDEGKRLIFDFSSYDNFSSVTAAPVTVPVTGLVGAREGDESYDDRFAAIGAQPGRVLNIAYNTETASYSVEIAPDHIAGADIYYKSGYWSSSESAFKVTINGTDETAVFSGDTVVVDNKSSQDPMYFGASLPVNVAAIKIAKNVRISSGDTSGAAILGGATVTVADACTLTIQWNNHNINLGTVVLNKVGENGTGAVVLDTNGGTITVSGAITGTAPIAIAENKSVTVAATGSIANTVELKSGSTLVVNSGATVGDVVTNVAHSRVVTSEAAGVTTYRVELIPGTIFSVW